MSLAAEKFNCQQLGLRAEGSEASCHNVMYVEPCREMRVTLNRNQTLNKRMNNVRVCVCVSVPIGTGDICLHTPVDTVSVFLTAALHQEKLRIPRVLA